MDGRHWLAKAQPQPQPQCRTAPIVAELNSDAQLSARNVDALRRSRSAASS